MASIELNTSWFFTALPGTGILRSILAVNAKGTGDCRNGS